MRVVIYTLKVEHLIFCIFPSTVGTGVVRFQKKKIVKYKILGLMFFKETTT